MDPRNWQRPTRRGLLKAFLKAALLLTGIAAIVVQVTLAIGVSHQLRAPEWDGAQNWYQAQRIRAGEPLYAPIPWYGPHVMANQMEGGVRYPLDRSAHLPLPAAVVALTPLRSSQSFATAWIWTLLVALVGFSSVLAILAHGRWTLAGFLWWHGAVFAMPYTHYAFRTGNLDPILWLLFALAVALPARLGVGALAMSAAIKPFAAWPLAFWLARDRSTWTGAIVGTAAAGVVCLLAMGPADLARNVRDWVAYVPGTLSQGTFHPQNVSISFALLRMAYWLGWWDYQPGPILEVWPRIWLTVSQLAGPVAAGLLSFRSDHRFHLSIVLLAAMLFSPLCWAFYLVVVLVPVAVWIDTR